MPDAALIQIIREELGRSLLAVQVQQLQAAVRSGVGSPETVLSGRVGDIYRRTDGGAGSTFWIKESGDGTNTGWVAK